MRDFRSVLWRSFSFQVFIGSIANDVYFYVSLLTVYMPQMRVVYSLNLASYHVQPFLLTLYSHTALNI